MWILTSTMVTVLAVTTSDIKSDEVVVFYPGYASLDPGGKTWTASIHGVIYEPEDDSSKRALLVAAVRRAAGAPRDTLEAKILDGRVRYFLVDNERGKEISVRLGSRVYEVGTSGSNGHFSGTLKIPAGEARRLATSQPGNPGSIPFVAVTRSGDHRRFAGRIQLIPPSGLSCISDIDDTIKITQVGNRKAMLANTFFRRFQPAPGMPELYRECADRGTAFHYVSGSPWQLYRPLSEFFRAEGFPSGSFHLKDFRLKDPSALNLLTSQEKNKLEAIESILAAFPGRLFVLIGDSGEEDPEIYGKVARKWPQQVVAVLIRNVTGEAAESQRFRTAFDRIARERWQVFQEPGEIRPLLTGLAEASKPGP